MNTARIIKKYPNRRLYDTEESRYITLADVKSLVVSQTEFVVVDRKTDKDITRSILLQVIADEEHNGEAILSEAFLEQIIRCYGNGGPDLVSGYLERSLRDFMAEPHHEDPFERAGTDSVESKKPLTSGP